MIRIIVASSRAPFAHSGGTNTNNAAVTESGPILMGRTGAKKVNLTTLVLLASLSLLVGCGGGGGSSSSPSEPPVSDAPTSESETPAPPSQEDEGEDTNLPSGLPAGTPDIAPPPRPEGPTLQPVSSIQPESDQPSTGGFDSTQTEFETLRTTPSTGNDNGCHHLMAGMLIDRGLPEETEDQPELDGFERQAWWYYTQGYMVAFGWSGPTLCEALDFRFVPTTPPADPVDDPSQNDSDDSNDSDTPPEPVAEEPPNSVDFVLVDFIVQSFGSPGVKMRVTNNLRSSRIYNVACDVHAINGSTIIDTAFVYFANGGTIEIGESAEDDGTFFSLESFDDFETTRWECDWLIR